MKFLNVGDSNLRKLQRKDFDKNFVICTNESVLIFFYWKKRLSDFKKLENLFWVFVFLVIV